MEGVRLREAAFWSTSSAIYHSSQAEEEEEEESSLCLVPETISGLLTPAVVDGKTKTVHIYDNSSDLRVADWLKHAEKVFQEAQICTDISGVLAYRCSRHVYSP